MRCGGAHRGVHRGRPGERGQLHRLGHLRADPRCARGSGLGQPGPGAVADRQECRLRLGDRPGLRRPRCPVRLLRVARVVRQVDPGVPWRGQPVAGDLGQAQRTRPGPVRAQRQRRQVRDHGQLITVGADPHLSAHQARRGGIPHAAEPDRLIGVHHPGLPERGGMRRVRQLVQPSPLGLQPPRRHRARLPVHAPVHHLTELPAGLRQPREAGIPLPQVRLGGHQVRLGDLHRRLRPALRFRVIRHAGMHRHPVIPAHGDDLRMPDRDAGDMLDGDGLLVIGQRRHRHPADPPQHRVQARDQRRQRPVPGRQHHPEPRPRQPRAEQQRRPRRPVRPRHLRALAPVPLQPQPRLRPVN